MQEQSARISASEIISLREWLDTWGDGPNWSDASGKAIPMQKEQLRRLLDRAEELDEQIESLIQAGASLHDAALEAVQAFDRDERQNILIPALRLALKQAIKKLWMELGAPPLS